MFILAEHTEYQLYHPENHKKALDPDPHCATDRIIFVVLVEISSNLDDAAEYHFPDVVVQEESVDHDGHHRDDESDV